MSADGLRVLVCGGREFEQYGVMSKALMALHVERRIALIINGGAPGADRFAANWAEHQRIPVATYPANWRFVGKIAGPVRNASMLTFGKPDMVLAFPGGRGTADMVKQARAAGVDVVEVSP